MNPPAKLVAFLALLAVVFGVSYFTGTQSQALLAPEPTHNSEMVAPPGTVEGYAVRAVEPTQEPGKDVLVELAVTADRPTVTEHPGTVLGPYKLLQEIGESELTLGLYSDLAGSGSVLATSTARKFPR